MARPIHANAEATRLEILRAAQRLFADRGLEGTTMRQIAADAGVTMATVHHYFGNKAGLHEECTREYREELSRLRIDVSAALRGAASLSDAIELGIRRAWTVVREHRSMVRLMIRNVVDTGETLPETRDETLRPMLDQGAHLLAPILKRPPAEVRLALTSVVYVVARFGLNSPAELALLVGTDDDPETVDAAVEGYLVTATRQLLGL